MKKLIIAVVLLTSFSANAWDINRNGVGVSNVNPQGAFALIESSGWMGFSFGSTCTKRTYKEETQVIIVNGVGVQMESICNSGSETIGWYPVTELGNTHIMQEFAYKNQVRVDDKVISAKGFKKVLDIIKKKIDGGI